MRSSPRGGCRTPATGKMARGFAILRSLDFGGMET
jgi:hypothetical protein